MFEGEVMNYRGQSFDVFQLLISAIIAGAILVILIAIIGGINFDQGSDPNSVIKGKLNTALNAGGAPQTVEKFAMSKTKPILATAITDGTEIAAEDLCISLGDFSGSTSVLEKTTDSPDVVVYKPTTGSQRVGFRIICGKSNQITSGLSALGTSSASSWSELCAEDWKTNCISDTGEKTCCIVAIVRS